jgi:hypothetical protein
MAHIVCLTVHSLSFDIPAAGPHPPVARPWLDLNASLPRLVLIFSHARRANEQNHRSLKPKDSNDLHCVMCRDDPEPQLVRNGGRDRLSIQLSYRSCSRGELNACMACWRRRLFLQPRYLCGIRLVETPAQLPVDLKPPRSDSCSSGALALSSWWV